MRPSILDDIGKNEVNSAQQLADSIDLYSFDCDLSIKIVQHNHAYMNITEMLGRIIDLFDIAETIFWDERSSCVLMNIKPEYKVPNPIPLLKLKRLARKLNKFFHVAIPNYEATIEIYKKNCLINTNCKLLCKDLVVTFDTINVNDFLRMIQKLQILI